jgi:hypothetical protein
MAKLSSVPAAHDSGTRFLLAGSFQTVALAQTQQLDCRSSTCTGIFADNGTGSAQQVS